MSIAEELERLGELHRDGTLNDEEFAQAKRRLLEQSDSPSQGRSLGEAANRYVSFQVVMGVIGAIIFLFILFGIILPNINHSRGPAFPDSMTFTPTR